MINKNFVEGVNIISKYVKEDGFDISAEHDQIWFGEFDKVTEPTDIKKLKELNWFEDEDSWSFFP